MTDKRIEEIDVWDLPDTRIEESALGLRVHKIPDPTGANIQYLVDKINEIIQIVNEMEGK